VRVALGLLGSLAACGASQAPVVEAEAELHMQPCELAEGVVLDVPLGEEQVLGAADGGCLLVDESQESTAAFLLLFPADTEGAELLRSDVARFFVESGMMGESPRTRAGRLELFGRERAVVRWSGTPPDLPPSEGFAAAVRHGPGWILVLTAHPPGAPGALERLLASATL